MRKLAIAVVAAITAGATLPAAAQYGANPGPGVGPGPGYYDYALGYYDYVGGAAGGPPGASTGTRVEHHPTSTHRRMYMQGDVHRGSKITGSALSTRKLLHNQNSYR
jgi:hypothetical protein